MNLGSPYAFDIAYHMSWPNPGDPFYLANTTDNNARQGYYNVTGTPTMECDGTECGVDQYSITAAIQNRWQTPSPLWMNISTHASGTQIIVNCAIVADENITGNYVFHTMVLDRYTYLPNSPNGQPNHYSALLKIAPTSAGQPFSAIANDTVRYNLSIPIDPSWAMQDADIACFVQDNSTKEIIQATRVQVPLDFPNIVLNNYSVADVNGNLDGRVDPGETGQMVVTLENMLPFHDANQVVGNLWTEDPQINVTVGTVNFPNIASGDSVNNAANPFLFDVDPALLPHEVTFTVTVTAQPENFEASFPITFMVGRPDLLLVNDDPNGLFQSFYDVCLDSLQRVHDVWNQSQVGPLPEIEMDRYPTVIWYTGNDDLETLSRDEQQIIASYLDAGGKLLLSSQNLGDLWGQSAFYQEVLHAEHLQSAVTVAYFLTGVSGDPISDSTSLMLAGSGGAGNATSCASLNPIPPAQGIYTYNSNLEFGALRYELNNTRLVYFCFPFEAISGLGSTTSRTQILANCLEWLETPVGVQPEIIRPQFPDEIQITSLYPNPFNPATEISFALPEAGFAEISIYDLQGRLVQNLAKGEFTAGQHKLNWEASSLQSGIYFVRLQQGNQIRSVKAVLLK